MKLLDLFCGAGGCARGYQLAGFHVTGVDNRPQPRYVGEEFHRGDALEFLAEHGHEFDAIHASPPCQRYSQGTKRWVGRAESHPDLIDPTRKLLQSSGRPWVIENVIGAPLHRPTLLCGTMFGLKVFRHRLFESESLLLAPSHPKHNGSTGAHRGYSTERSGRNGYICVAGHNFVRESAASAMRIDWMSSRAQLAQAIPPAYTRYIGLQLMSALCREQVA